MLRRKTLKKKKILRFREERASIFPVRKKFCRFCKDKSEVIDYKQSVKLSKFITERGKIVPSRLTGTCAKHQRRIAKAIKRARVLSLLPFVAK